MFLLLKELKRVCGDSAVMLNRISVQYLNRAELCIADISYQVLLQGVELLVTATNSRD